MFINFLFIFFISFITGIVAIFLFKKLALKYGFFILKGIPLVGGISIALAFIFGSLSGCFLFHLPLKAIMGIVFSSAIMLVFGLFDDHKELSIKAKLLIQIIAASVLILSGIRTKIICIGGLANILITLIWIIGITNAFNHLDIMDGLAAGVAIIVSGAFFTISFLNQDIQTVILILALLSAIPGFLIYNLPPAKIYLGNSGSHFLGFVLSVIAITIHYASMERKIALFAPILILGLPIFDTFFVSILRLKKRILPFKKSNDHLALILLKSGYSTNKILTTMFLLALVFALSGVALSKVPNFLGIILIFVILPISVISIVIMSKIRGK